MANPILLVDYYGCSTLKLTESADNGRLSFIGKCQEANAVNRNKRLYSYEVLNSNVEKLQEKIENRSLIGELDHATDSILHLSNASHLINRLFWDKNNLMMEAEILGTPSGDILKNLIESGIQVGISSRGVGNGQTNNEGVLVIDNSYKLISFDVVCDESTYGATIKKVIGSGKNEIAEPRSTPVRTEQINHNALASYFGSVLAHKLTEAKENIKKK